MVKERIIDGKTYYQCEECEFYFKDKEWAQKCEDFCRKNKSCSLELMKHAVNPEEDEKRKTCDVNCKGDEKEGCC